MDSKFLIEADSEDSDQIGQWLIWVFAELTDYLVGLLCTGS